MIKSIKSKKLRDLFCKEIVKGVNPLHLKKVIWILGILDAMESLDYIDKSLNLHKLSGNLNGFWSLKVSGNWRIIFRFENGQVEDVDYIDYH